MSKMTVDDLDAFMNETSNIATTTPTVTTTETTANEVDDKKNEDIIEKTEDEMTGDPKKGFTYDKDGNRYLLGISFPEMRKKFDGEDKEYIAELANTYMALLEKLVENSKNKEHSLAWIKSTDFFHAPASTRYHSAFEGGLLYHSLLVMECLINKMSGPIWNTVLEHLSIERAMFAAMLHDICKTNFYSIEYRNKKVYSENGSKSDELGKFDWKSIPSYGIEEKFAFGHGEKSVYLLEHHFFRLDDELASAIRAHMGPYIEQDRMDMLFGNMVDAYPLVLALYEADQEATFIYEYRTEEPKVTISNGLY